MNKSASKLAPAYCRHCGERLPEGETTPLCLLCVIDSQNAEDQDFVKALSRTDFDVYEDSLHEVDDLAYGYYDYRE